jgi:Arc/MetJ family transcription regulator
MALKRTTIEIDDDLLAEVMHRFGFVSKSEAVNTAVCTLAEASISREELFALRESNLSDRDI